MSSSIEFVRVCGVLRRALNGRAGRLAAALALAAGLVSAQGFDAAAIGGVVVDENGRRPIEGVEVQLIDVSSGRITSNWSDRAGRFAFSRLASGRYSLAFLHDAYVARRAGPYELLPDSPIATTTALSRLGPPLSRPRAGLETIAIEYGLVREQIGGAPTLLGSSGRTAVDKLQLLAPGMSPVAALEIDPITGRGAPVSANGSRRSAIHYLLDGASSNAQNRLTGAQASTFAPPPEAIETFRIITHTYSASEGRNSGAVVRTVTRHASQQWHGQARGFYRPHQGSVEAFDGSVDSLEAWAGGGQAGGPLWPSKRLFMSLDAEAWTASRRRLESFEVLSMAERSGDLSSTTDPPVQVAPHLLHPLVQEYLDAFVPEPNAGENLYQTQRELPAEGQMLTARLDKQWDRWTFSASHLTHRAESEAPLLDALAVSPGTASVRRQLANNAQASVTFAPSARFTQTTRVAGQRLSITDWRGRPDFRNATANDFGFDFESFGANPGTLPDVTLWSDTGERRLWIAPFLSSEASAQTTWQISHDFSWRLRGATLRGGALYRRGLWPFLNTENFAGSFSFPAPPEPPIRARPNALRDLLLGAPGEYRLQTPRDLNLRWRELAIYGETELHPAPNLTFTAGIRFESQPPAVDSQDRIAGFRSGAQSSRFPEALPGLIFPGDPDGELGVLPRSTVSSSGRNIAPRIGVSFSPVADGPLARILLGEPGRAVFRGSYGVFYDFGAFAGSSAAALFQATYPPFSVDNRFDLSRSAAVDPFRRPLGAVPENPAKLVPTVARYPILVFDRDFRNAAAEQWNLGFQRVLPSGIFLSAVYLGAQTSRLQRQVELNEFVYNPLRSFTFVRSMRRYSRYTDIRQFESTGQSRYNAMQLRANRYLRRGLAFEAAYTWSRSDDNGSAAFADELATDPWSVSSFDRRHNLTASWLYDLRLPRGLTSSMPWLDRWTMSGVWRWRSGLPLDVRQSEDPTFTFQYTGRPDLIGDFRMLDPSEIQTLTLADGRTLTGRFAFDPTAFARVTPTDFDETRPGSVGRNAFRMAGFQQLDLRLTRSLSLSENVSAEFGLDLFNVFGFQNWDAPFADIDHPYFGIVAGEGLGRTAQAALRLLF